MGEVLQTWLGSYELQSTRNTFCSIISVFMEFIYGVGDVYEQVDRYMEEKSSDIKKILSDIDRYWIAMKKYAPMTRTNKLSGLRTFFADSYLEIPEAYWRKFGKRGEKSRPISEEKMLTPRQVRSVLVLMRAAGTALILTLVSTGARIGATLQIELTDVALEKDPPRIYLRGITTKNKQSRIVFLTQEAKDAIEDWLTVRKEYIRKKKVPRGRKRIDELRLFPFSVQNAYRMWFNALDALGLTGRDPRTKRRHYRLHGFRKFFRTYLSTEIPVDVVETLLGHEGYQTISYRRYTEEDLAKYYKHGCHVLMIFIERAEIAKVAAQNEENNAALQEQLGEKEREMNAVKLKMVEMTATLAGIEAELKMKKDKE